MIQILISVNFVPNRLYSTVSEMANRKKKSDKTEKQSIQTVRATKKELKEATDHALKQYKTAVKNLANR